MSCAIGPRCGAALRCDRAQHRGQCGVLQAVAHRPRLAIGAIEVGRGIGLAAQRLLRLQLRMQPRADREALFREADRRLEHLRPRQLAVALVRQLEHAHRPGYADGAPAHHRLVERHRFAIGLQEELLVGRGRRGLAAVEGVDVLAIPMQQERATADAARLRLDQREHHLHRDRRIDCRAARVQRAVTGLGGQRVGCSHCKTLCQAAGAIDARCIDWCSSGQLRMPRRRRTRCQPQRGRNNGGARAQRQTRQGEQQVIAAVCLSWPAALRA
jgi:hypothetical protein